MPNNELTNANKKKQIFNVGLLYSEHRFEEMCVPIVKVKEKAKQASKLCLFFDPEDGVSTFLCNIGKS
jgi:hypothetical protein